ncbi:MAG: NADH-quinone oxidoreductase subunit C [Candidatus Omnitrophica bacterium]|nr:NADH-quinone oxidoreductase subunit C [Candidatus Omnitrophota bacterium]
MSQEENITQSLVSQFGFLEGNIRITRPRRIFLETSLENFPKVFAHAVKELKFNHLCTITGFDELDKLAFMYHLAQESGVLLNLKTSVSKDNPTINTVMPLFPGAEIYERELVDLFGAKVNGLPLGNRYPLTDDWPKDQYPLRKDWKPSQLDEKEGHTHA